jgi:transcriptional antiterminator RfaH
MNGFQLETEPRWYVIHTKPKQENRTYANLQAWGIKTFSPLLKERQYKPHSSQSSYVNKPLFPQYLFAQFNAEALLHKICFTRGVHNVVSFGGKPVPLDDEVIECLKVRVDEDGFVKPSEEFRPGDKVVIKDGPLKEIAGALERDLRDHERVLILLEVVNYQARVLIERELIKKDTLWHAADSIKSPRQRSFRPLR